MATQKTQTKNEKIVEQTDPNLENEVQQDTTPLWDRVKQPAIMTAIFLFAAFMYPEAKHVQNILFIIATVSGIITIAIAFGYRPKDNNKNKYQSPDYHTDPTYKSLSINVFNQDRGKTDRF